MAAIIPILWPADAVDRTKWPARNVERMSLARTSLPPLPDYLAAGEARGLVWTKLRKQVIEFLWKDGGFWGPYALSDRMRPDGVLRYPNSLYRVFRCLEEVRLLVYIPTRKRFQISPDPSVTEWGVLNCMDCDRAALVPVDELAETVRDAASALQFSPTNVVIECEGQCSDCDSKRSRTRRTGRLERP